jgi:YVTN family beta-propeller protein
MASTGGSNPNVIALQVMISNPTIYPIQLTAISITIPSGQEGALTLSDNPNLPAPEYDTNSGWSGSTSGDTVVFTLPSSGIADSFIFTLPGIQVNETPGTVPLAIVEDGPPRVVDKTTYSLVKQPSDFPITNFYAQPATVNNLDETVTLFWDCTALGANYAYSVHSDSWQPDDCLNGGNCYSCTDGTNGIQSDPLTQTTRFALDVIQTNPDGSRSIYRTLETNVRVLIPTISNSSYYETYLSGRVVRLHWLAFNSAYCTVSLDGGVIDSNAPIDTFAEGYWVVLSEPGLHQLTVTAHAASGPAQSNFIFPNINVDPVITIQTGGGYLLAITPDGTTALIQSSQSLSAVDIASGTVSTKVSVAGSPSGLAITPDGTRVFVLPGPGANPNQMLVMDLPGLTVEQSIPLGCQPNGIAITPDGTLALLAGWDAQGNSILSVIDIASMSEEANTIPVGNFPQGPVVTPDGTLALTANYNDNTVTVVDIASRSTVATIPVAAGPIAIAVTPDGLFALTANSGDNNIVSVVDIVNRILAGNISAGVIPNGIATLATPPNGALGLLLYNDAATVTFVDIANRVALSPVLHCADDSWALAVMPDGSHVLITSVSDPVLTQI